PTRRWGDVARLQGEAPKAGTGTPDGESDAAWISCRMTPRPFQRLLAAAASVLLLGLGSTASAQLLRYTGDGWAVAVTGPAPAIVTDHSGPDPWLAFEMLFDPAEEPIASSATSTTYAALSGWVQVNDHLLLLTDPTLEITREPTTPP